MNAPGVALFAGDVSLDTTTVVDHVPEPDEKVHASALVEDVGGVVANAAIACCLAGSPVALLATFGADLAGTTCRALLRQRGVALRTADGRGTTSRALITLDSQGEKRLVLAAGASIYPDELTCRDANLGDVTWLHTAVYDLVGAALLVSRCRAAGVRWSLDLEPATLREGLDPLRPCLDGATTVFVNARAAALLGDAPTDALFAAGVAQVVYTLGALGARLHTVDRHTVVDPTALPGPVVDTTGAGDCLAGTYVAGLLLGRDPVGALQHAVAAASLSCCRLGGPASYPAPAEVSAKLGETVPGTAPVVAAKPAAGERNS
ncbi:MAG: ribokinase [Mycobacterium sp.]|jgi:ribokinase|nr:ribokinase [Mycobacterium sp.]